MNQHRYYPSLRSTLKAWHRFTGLVQQRLRRGAREYNNESFSRDPRELLHELQEECLDLAGWAFILHARLKDAEWAFDRVSPFYPPPNYPKDR